MEDLEVKIRFTKNGILDDLIKILEEMTGDWEMGFEEKIGSETYLVADLDFKSINVAQLVSLIEERFEYNDFPFQDLIITPDGRAVDDLRVMDVVEFLYSNLTEY